jgi:phosphoglycolate phosphatase
MIQVFRPIPVEKLKLMVFDLDGTLIDSAQDLCNSVNASLSHAGMENLPDPVVAGFVGNGVPLLLRRALAHKAGIAPEAVDGELFSRTQRFFLEYYRDHKLDFTYAYEGVLDALEALRGLHDTHGGAPRRMAILTNKPVRPSWGICAGLGINSYFERIYGGDSFKTKKPEPEGLVWLMRELGVTPEETVMIGDSKGDVHVARNAGAWSLGCAFGFGPQNIHEAQPDILVDSPKEWTAVLAPKQS